MINQAQRCNNGFMVYGNYEGRPFVAQAETRFGALRAAIELQQEIIFKVAIEERKVLQFKPRINHANTKPFGGDAA